jgi:NAD(P)-dependent dehydrogenase (short-subunit alcohol dehydrogenase family)
MSLDQTRRVSEDGIEATLATNVFGPFLLTDLLRDRLRGRLGVARLPDR